MTRTENIYNLVKEHRAEFLKKQEELDKRAAALEPIKGSRQYDESMRQINEERRSMVVDLRKKYATQVDEILNIILETFKKTGLPIEAPTDEALRTLQLLKMRQELASNDSAVGNITKEEFMAAIPNMGGNASAYKLLQELAQRNGVVMPALNKSTFSADDFERALNGIAKGLHTTFNLPRLNNKASYGQALYNGMEYADAINQIKNLDGMKYDNAYKSLDEFLSAMTFLTGAALEQFKAIADKE